MGGGECLILSCIYTRYLIATLLCVGRQGEGGVEMCLDGNKTSGATQMDTP